MRYYQPFPVAIPRFGAGHQRVTHPFATKDAMQAKHPSFDLHVLGTPPAFILSQDQTLRKILSPFQALFTVCVLQKSTGLSFLSLFSC